MNELALFAGAGGSILGGHLLGWRTICAVEINPYARQVLLARQADGCLPRFPVWDDITTFDGTPWRGHVDIVSGGFPCQDISAAGKGAGITGERSGLWSQMARIVSEVRPSFVWVENSPLLVDRGLAVVLGDLAKMGYDARWGVVGAHHASAPHKRDRIWILAYAQSKCNASGLRAERETRHLSERGSDACRVGNVANQSRGGDSDHQAADVAYSASIRGEAGVSGQKSREEGVSGESLDDSAGWQGKRSWWGAEPHMGGVADGVASGVDIHGVHAGLDVGRVAEGISGRAKRLHAIGNGQVPAALVLAWHLLTGESHMDIIQTIMDVLQYVAMTDTVRPPKGVREAAALGLWLRERQPPSNRAGTPVGLARARDLANGRPVSYATMKRMKAYFDRHEVDKQASGWRPSEEGYPSKGYQAWLLWGGDEGQRWALSELRKAKLVDKDGNTL